MHRQSLSNLKKGEKKRVPLVLNEDAFSFLRYESASFCSGKGEFEILAGPASNRLPLKVTVGW